VGVFALLLAGVTAGAGAVSAVYNLAEPPESDIGGAQFAAWVEGDSAKLATVLDAGGYRYGSIDSTTVLVNGTTERVAARSIDPTNPVTAPLVDLVSGRFPERSDEVALTSGAVVGAAPGDGIVLNGVATTVVGIIENPTDLHDGFVLAPSVAVFGSEIDTRFLIDADQETVDLAAAGTVFTSATGAIPRTALAMAVNVLSAFAMLEVGLLASAGFGVIARRQMRNFGLLAATGATPRQIRSVATQAGFLLGVAAASVGTAAGVAFARFAVPKLETAVGHRIAFAVPWWSIAINMVVAVTVASLAARWPSRSLTTRPVSDLLNARRPREASVGWPAATGLVLAVLGAIALAFGFAKLDLLAAVAGVLLAPIGLLLMAPLVVGLLSRATKRMPLAMRLAGRSVGRHNRRSAAVLAALALALAIPVAVAVVTSSIDAHRADRGPNLADNMAIAWQPGTYGGTTWIPADLDGDRLTLVRERLAMELPRLTVVPIEAAIMVDGPREVRDFDDIGSQAAVPLVVAGRKGSNDCVSCQLASYGEADDAGNEVTWIFEDTWIATPELTAALGIDSPTGVAVARSDVYQPLGYGGPLDGATSVSATWPNNASVPPLLISEAAVEAGRFERATIGLLLVGAEPLDEATSDQIRTVVAADLAVELPKPPSSQSGVRAAAITIGVVVGLVISLAAVGLLIVEVGDDLSVLHTLGADPGTTRQLAAGIALIVAVGGAMLALTIGYVALVPLLAIGDLEFPFVVPWRTVLSLLVAFPAGAAASAWFGSRRLWRTTRAPAT
jgi:putative ABC transport system permease protein